MALSGLRIGELSELRWRNVDLARGKLTIEDAKSDAGRRDIEISPWLLDELKLHKVSTRFDSPGEFVFATRNGTKRNRSNTTRQILRPAIGRANEKRKKRGNPADPGRRDESQSETNVLQPALRGGRFAGVRDVADGTHVEWIGS